MLKETAAVAAGVLIGVQGVFAQQPPPDYGFDFVTIGDAGNDPWMGTDVTGRITNPGAVNYEYRIARFETRTSQFIEFMNVIGSIDPNRASIVAPTFWGASGSFQPDGTVRFTQFSEESGDYPVVGISWRLAARYANWLHNDKAATADAINFGAYDTTTFESDPDTGDLLDQVSRSPDARYWIPSLDEWFKAAHYDPNRNGPGEGGYWDFPNGNNEPLTPGLPGEPGAETSYRVDEAGFNELTIPVGAYPETQSPWGLLDVSGGATEWTETYLPGQEQRTRIWGGSLAGEDRGLLTNEDAIGFIGADSPQIPGGRVGLRIASAIPSPSSAVLLGMVMVVGGTRRRRR
ncbi:MAG: SUMF1/EgtB/PvdO family nonheme iron enzyme [Planctomycetota bacterium]